jgi:hypothetical protein
MFERDRTACYTYSVPSDHTSPGLAPSPASGEAPVHREVSPPSAPADPVDPLLSSILSGAQGRVEQDRARARAAGLIDADGRVLTDRWPEDMRPDSRASVETG